MYLAWIMARRLRLHIPNSTYHVMLRGNDGQPIFFSELDRSRLCFLMQQGVERFGHQIEAFCFMSNHIHMALRVSEISISRIMQHLAFCYARYINWKYKRVGHLFQGRFKSVLIDDEEYLIELIRYIHLNPVRAGIVSNPLEYVWSSHRAYLDQEDIFWLSKDRVLKKFHMNKKDAISNYEKYVFNGIGLETQNDFKWGCASGVLGETEYIEKVLEKIQPKPLKKFELQEIVTKVCEFNHITLEELKMPGKHQKSSQARALLAFLVRQIDNLSFETLGEFLGRDPSGLTKLANRLEIKMVNNKAIAENVLQLRQTLLLE